MGSGLCENKILYAGSSTRKIDRSSQLRVVCDSYDVVVCVFASYFTISRPTEEILFETRGFKKGEVVYFSSEEDIFQGYILGRDAEF